MKVETHNHPTAISPFPGAATGSGGEIRDEGATGRGAQAQGGADRLLGLEPAPAGRGAALGERPRQARPHRLARSRSCSTARSAAPRSTTSSAGRTSAATSAPSSWRSTGPAARGARLSQADHDRRRPRQHRAPSTSQKARFPAGAPHRRARRPGDADRPGRRRGVVDGRRAPRAEDLDFASVQRDNAEMQRRCQEVIDRCWRAGRRQPDPLDPRRRRRRPVERAARAGRTTAGAARASTCATIPNDEPGMSPLEIWCNEAQERYVLADRARARSPRSRRSARASAARTRSSATPPTTASWW